MTRTQDCCDQTFVGQGSSECWHLGGHLYSSNEFLTRTRNSLNRSTIHNLNDASALNISRHHGLFGWESGASLAEFRGGDVSKGWKIRRGPTVSGVPKVQGCELIMNICCVCVCLSVFLQITDIQMNGSPITCSYITYVYAHVFA